MKRLPVFLPDLPGTILVSGASEHRLTLYQRLQSAIGGQQGWQISLSESPIPGHDYLYHVGENPVFEPNWYKATYFFSSDLAQGNSVSQQTLVGSDWQATRDIERQLLAMHEVGIWQLPDDVRQRMLDREQMRSAVDQEISSVVQ